MQKTLSVSICIPAHNEGENIEKLLSSLVAQKTNRICINRIIIVSSGSTDDTNAIAQRFVQQYPQIELIQEKNRTGKAGAINQFLAVVNDPVIVIQSADTIANPDTIEKLCLPFLKDEKIGMTGGAPIPINDPDTCLGYIVHAWWWFHRNIPRFGEIIAFRNILPKIAGNSAVDEAYIQAMMVKQGYKVVHIDDARIHNKGPETFADLIRQRRRIFNGHSKLNKDEGVKIDNMTRSTLWLLLFKFKPKSNKHFFWLLWGIILEIYSRVLGAYDQYMGNINTVWDVAKSTKKLDFDLAVGEE